MKNAVKAILVAVLALGALVSAKAQNTAQDTSHDYRTETCNQALKAGFKGLRGDGPSGEMKVKFYITTNYTMKDLESTKREFPGLFTSAFNEVAAKNNQGLRLLAVDYNSDEKFNFLIFVNIAKTGNAYQIAYDVHGWGQHHLFTYVTPSFEDTGADTAGPVEAVAAGVTNLPDYFEYGWKCGN